MASLDHAPYYAIHIAPAIHYTMGGIHIAPDTKFMIQMAILLQDYMLLVKLVVVCMEIIELAVIQLLKRLFLT